MANCLRTEVATRISSQQRSTKLRFQQMVVLIQGNLDFRHENVRQRVSGTITRPDQLVVVVD